MKPITDRPQWVNRVADLEDLGAGQSPLQPGSTERFIARLDAANNKKKSFAWRAAAAVTIPLFLTLGIALLVTNSGHKRGEGPRNYGTAPKTQPITQPTTIEKAAQPLQIKQRTVEAVVNLQPRKAPMAPGKTSNPLPGKLTDSAVSPGQAQFAVVKQEPLPEIVSVATTPAPRKSIGISHINDYVDRIETSPGITMKPVPMRRFIRGTKEEAENAAVAAPMKPNSPIKSSTIQN